MNTPPIAPLWDRLVARVRAKTRSSLTVQGLSTGGALLLVGVLIWLFAEAQSVVDHELQMRVRFVAPADSGLFVRSADNSWTGTVKVRLTGSRSAMDRMSVTSIELPLGVAGIPADIGMQRASLREAIANIAPFARSGVRVVSVEPGETQLHVEEMTTTPSLPVQLSIDGVALAKEPELRPATVSVTGPSSVLARLGPKVRAVVDAETIRSLRPGHTETVQARIVLPQVPRREELRVDPESVTVVLAVESQESTATLVSVPVWVLAPPGAKVHVDIAEGSRFLRDITIRGPSDIVERVVQREIPVKAFVEITDDDIYARTPTKMASFAHLEGLGIEFVCEDATVELVYRSLPLEDSETQETPTLQDDGVPLGGQGAANPSAENEES